MPERLFVCQKHCLIGFVSIAIVRSLSVVSCSFRARMRDTLTAGRPLPLSGTEPSAWNMAMNGGWSDCLWTVPRCRIQRTRRRR
eukprot:COSAG01_NODE_14017_length_1506_cov_581.437811_2_plen_84_part_00